MWQQFVLISFAVCTACRTLSSTLRIRPVLTIQNKQQHSQYLFSFFLSPRRSCLSPAVCRPSFVLSQVVSAAKELSFASVESIYLLCLNLTRFDPVVPLSGQINQSVSGANNWKYLHKFDFKQAEDEAEAAYFIYRCCSCTLEILLLRNLINLIAISLPANVQLGFKYLSLGAEN